MGCSKRTGRAVLGLCLCLAATLAFAPAASATHARPKGATPKYNPLVIAYKQCTAASATLVHRVPIGPAACPASATTQVSPWVTVCEPGAWGCPANFVSVARIDVQLSPPDLKLKFWASDVRCSPALSAPCGTQAPRPLYGGELQVVWNMRITDHCNAASPPSGCGSPAVAGTMTDVPFPVTTPCSTTLVPPANNCTVTTTANTVVPGTFIALSRSNIETHVHVDDGGADATAATAPNTTFASEGVFLP